MTSEKAVEFYRAHRIDQLQEIDLATVKAEDLVRHYGTGIAITHGTGRQKTHSYRNGIQTDIGDLELSVWIAAVEYVIQRDGLEEELSHLMEFENCNGKDRSQKSSAKQDCLCACISGLYKNPEWAAFVAYNRRYHPEVLERAHLVCIIPECCQMPGDTTAEQIARSYNGTVCCPFCGRFSKYKLASNEEVQN